MTLEKFLDGYADRGRVTDEKVVLGIEVLATGRLIGLVALSDIDREVDMAEITVYIGEKDEWGKGYAPDAMRTLCRHGFGTLALHRIHLGVAVGNESAVRSYEKLGFVKEGRTRHTFRTPDGEWQDHFIMGLFEGELNG